MMASTKPGDIVLDPFFGSGTTGAVAQRLGRHFVGIEREQAYIDAAKERIDAVRPLDGADLTVLTGKRAEPRVAFVSLIDTGLMTPGATLYDAKKRWAPRCAPTARWRSATAPARSTRSAPKVQDWMPATAGPSGTMSAAAA